MLQWPKLEQTSAHLAGMWSDRPERKLPTFQLDEFVTSVEGAWRAGKNLESLTGREAKWLPHVVFHPEADRKAWLARDSRLMGAALARIKQRPGSMRALLKNVFRLWPTELEAAPAIWRTLSSQLLIATSPKLREWNRRVQQYDLLREDGPERFARLLRSGQRSRAEVTEDAGLVAELSQSGFLAAVDRAIVQSLRTELERKDFSGLDAALQLIAPSGTLTFKAEAAGVAEALLGPFVRQSPPKDVKENITNFLLRHLHDPRSTQAGWAGVSHQARGVMLQWLVEVTLEQFFDLIGRWANEEHWRYREAFGSAFRKRGHIDKAWVVLGANAADEARRRWRDAPPAHGRLYGGSADHCVLMLEIGDLTVVEWSHNGACRVWRTTNKHRPKLYDSEYTQHRLQAQPDGAQRHGGNLSYGWQQKLADTIREETGRSVTQSDYRVR
jgi:hypothetical protein